jgi:hypothetical protein
LISQANLIEDRIREGTFVNYNPETYWKKIAGNILFSKRRTGKTSGLIKYADNYLVSNGQVIVVVPNSHFDKQWKQAGFKNIFFFEDDIQMFFSGRDITKLHLVADEFQKLKPNTLQFIYSKWWKSLTMVGSL